jgi:hypothetical protein
MDEIRNKVQESGLISMDLAAFKPKETIVGIDLKNQLWQELVLKEKDFRAWIKETDWSQYQGQAVHIYCSTDAIIPTWAYMLVASVLIETASIVLVGSKLDLQKEIIRRNIEALDLTPYLEGRIIIKGCSDIPAPNFSMVELNKHLQPHVKSIMYGEPCSTVPVYKRKSK